MVSMQITDGRDKELSLISSQPEAEMGKRPLRWKCQTCNLINSELLEAPNPFDASLTIYGCPGCKDVNCFVNICDEPGCTDEATCGWPDEDRIYRRTCYRHYASK